MFGLIFWSSLWLVLICQFFTRKRELQFRKNIVMGVTLPHQAREDPEVMALLQNDQKQNRQAFFLLLAACVAGAFIPDLTISLICWAVMLVTVLVIPMGLFARTNRKLRELKNKRGWTASSNQIRVNVSAMVSYPKPKKIGYVLAAAMCVLPMLFQPRLRWAHLLSVGIVAASYWFSLHCYRKKSEAVDENTDLTKTLSLLRYRMWKRIWLASAFCACATSLSLWMMEVSAPAGMAMILLLSPAFCSIVVGIELETRKLQQQLTADSGTDWYVDEDEFWPYGLFYYNPNDSHTFVNVRTGVGSTFNLATTGGKLITGIGAVIVVGALVLVVSLALADRSPIELGRTEDFVFCENGGTRYEIPLDEIKQTTLLDQMPDSLWRTMGMGGQHLHKGSFTCAEMPDLRILADPTVPPFLTIETSDGTYYMLGTRDSKITQGLYADLQKLLPIKTP